MTGKLGGTTQSSQTEIGRGISLRTDSRNLEKSLSLDMLGEAGFLDVRLRGTASKGLGAAGTFLKLEDSGRQALVCGFDSD